MDENMGSGLRTFRPALLLIALIGFFMPFVTVSCGNQKLVNYTGFQLANGVAASSANQDTNTATVSPPVASSTEKTIGRVGVVNGNNIPIVAGREQSCRLLSHVPNGTSLTVTGQTDMYYAVMMVDGSTGFIAKDKVQLSNYAVTSNQPPDNNVTTSDNTYSSASTNEIVSSPKGPTKSVQHDALLSGAILCTFVGLIASLFALEWKSRGLDFGIMIVSCIGLWNLLVEKAVADDQIAKSLQQNPFIVVDYQYGFWVVVVLLAISAVLSFAAFIKPIPNRPLDAVQT